MGTKEVMWSKAALIAAAALVSLGASAAQPSSVFSIGAVGTVTPSAAAPASDTSTQAVEIDSAIGEGDDDADTDGGGDGSAVVNRSIVKKPGQGAATTGKNRAKSNPEQLLSVAGLNFFNQRFANHGNQFSVEPPDQALCVGGGFVLESVNVVLRIYDTQGNAQTGPIDLNTFYGYPPAINRAVSPLQFGPSITDPSCLYDADTQRWFHVVLTLDRASPTTQALAGTNHLDIAVSTSSNPLGSWVVYRLPVQNDGTQGTPDHHCVARSGTSLVHGPCLGDYPHIGADANGFYITTNEFNLAAPGFRGAQVYALDKKALAANAASVNVVLFDTADAAATSVQLDGNPGFTIWPAQSSPSGYAPDTEFMLSSEAVFQDSGVDTRLRVWTMSNTSSLASASPNPSLTIKVANVIPYAVPGSSFQKAGSVPLRDCIADPACAPLVGSAVNPNNTETRLPSNDSRMQQVFFANGKLWGALDTGLLINDKPQAGIAYFVLNPSNAKVVIEGYVGVENNNVTYPALAVTESGRGVIGFTLVDNDHYPSAAYTSLDAKVGTGDVHVIVEGSGPQDGFSGYVPLGGTPVARPRWGDYGGAATDGNIVWIASEYIGQTCTFAEYLAAPFGTCGNTRGSLGNWGTRITQLKP